MAIDVTEAWTGSGLTKGLDDGQWRATRVFHVTGATGKLEAIDAVGSVFGVAPGSTHPENIKLICGELSCDDNLVRRVITAPYSITTLGQFDPALKTTWNWVPGSVTELTDRDFYQSPLVNSAGVPYDQPGQKFLGTMDLTATRREPFYDAQKALAIQNRTNVDDFTVQGGGLVKCGQAFLVTMCSETTLYDGVPWAMVTYRFHFREGTLIDDLDPPEYDAFWDRRLDQGDSGWYADSNDVKQRGLICNAAGIETGTVLLDGTGKPLDSSLKILSSLSGSVAAPADNPNPLPTTDHKVTVSTGGSTVAVYIVRRQYGQLNILSLAL